jgi:outer membrane protein assembly factor BamE
MPVKRRNPHEVRQQMRYHKPTRRLIVSALALLGAACVYRIDVQQGNLLDDEDIEAVQDGMTRSQVRFLLGTPMVEDPFHSERWDYVYYLRRGKTGREEKRWLILFFENDKVAAIRKDVPFGDTA